MSVSQCTGLAQVHRTGGQHDVRGVDVLVGAAVSDVRDPACRVTRYHGWVRQG